MVMIPQTASKMMAAPCEEQMPANEMGSGVGSLQQANGGVMGLLHLQL